VPAGARPAKRESRAGARSLKTQQCSLRRGRRTSRRARNRTYSSRPSSPPE